MQYLDLLLNWHVLHNKKKSFQRYGVREINALFQRWRESFLGALCTQSDHADMRLLNPAHLLWADISGVMEDNSFHVKGN